MSLLPPVSPPFAATDDVSVAFLPTFTGTGPPCCCSPPVREGCDNAGGLLPVLLPSPPVPLAPRGGGDPPPCPCCPSLDPPPCGGDPVRVSLPAGAVVVPAVLLPPLPAAVADPPAPCCDGEAEVEVDLEPSPLSFFLSAVDVSVGLEEEGEVVGDVEPELLLLLLLDDGLL